jgi:hypothetical protein
MGMELRKWTSHRAGRLAAAGLVTLVAAAGCSAQSRSSSAPAADTAAGRSVPGPGSQAERGAAATRPGSQANLLDAVRRRAPVNTRAIVYKGDMTVRADDVDKPAAQATTIAVGAGGVVAGDNRREDGDDSTADLVLRVPAGAFRETVDKVAKLGKELNRGIHTDDVTDAVVDLDTRIASQKASVNRTRALLARAEAIGDVVTIEGELARREADLGSLQAQQKSLADQVTLSTITVHLIAPHAAAPAKAAGPSFLTGLNAGWHAFVASVNGLLVVLGALLPFLVTLGIPVIAAVLLLRRRRRPPAPVPATVQPEV